MDTFKQGNKVISPTPTRNLLNCSPIKTLKGIHLITIVFLYLLKKKNCYE